MEKVYPAFCSNYTTRRETTCSKELVQPNVRYVAAGRQTESAPPTFPASHRPDLVGVVVGALVRLHRCPVFENAILEVEALPLVLDGDAVSTSIASSRQSLPGLIVIPWQWSPMLHIPNKDGETRTHARLRPDRSQCRPAGPWFPRAGRSTSAPACRYTRTCGR